MLRIGLTGGIGCGKTTIAKIIETLGYPVYTSDTRASALINSDPEIKKNLVALFGENSYMPNGELDKKRLAAIIFHDKNAITRVNRIVHPVVTRDFERWCGTRKASLLFFESAILFESNLESYFDHVITITANLETRIRRVMARDGTSREKVEERINNQMPDATKRTRADFVIHNNDEDKIIPQILSIMDILNNRLND